MVCKVIENGDKTHTVFLGEVIESKVYENVPQMTYAYYHAVVKGKSRKMHRLMRQYQIRLKFLESLRKFKKTKFVCDVCGYVYESDTDTVPEGLHAYMWRRSGTFQKQ